MNVAKLTQEAVLRVGKVMGVDGRKIYVLVDRNKNLSDMFLDGEILRNLSVNSYIEIRKGFLSLIGRVDLPASFSAVFVVFATSPDASATLPIVS